MLVLAIDTAAAACAACLYDAAAGSVLAEKSETIGTGHAERLMGMIAEVLAQAGKTHADLGRIAVSVGPGSFTGVRTGVAAARGFALALNIPAIGVSTLETVAADAVPLAGGKPILAVIDAKRGQLYRQAFDASGRASGEPKIMQTEEALGEMGTDCILAGSGGPLLSAAGAGNTRLLEMRASGAIATFALLAAHRVAGPAPKPLYLRAPDAKPQAGFAVARAAGA
jgi:tRNA threonylcarbamoyladenosine biosynthesis protein TsaB